MVMVMVMVMVLVMEKIETASFYTGNNFIDNILRFFECRNNIGRT